MAILEIELQPDEQARLEQEAHREGLSMQDWARRRLTAVQPNSGLGKYSLSQDAAQSTAAKPLWEIIAELDAIDIPAEERARMPHDGSINYKHYLYGTPKIDVPDDLQ